MDCPCSGMYFERRLRFLAGAVPFLKHALIVEARLFQTSFFVSRDRALSCDFLICKWETLYKPLLILKG